MQVFVMLYPEVVVDAPEKLCFHRLQAVSETVVGPASSAHVAFVYVLLRSSAWLQRKD